MKNIESIYLTDNKIFMQTIKDNIYQLETLKNILIDFSQSKDYGGNT